MPRDLFPLDDRKSWSVRSYSPWLTFRSANTSFCFHFLKLLSTLLGIVTGSIAGVSIVSTTASIARCCGLFLGVSLFQRGSVGSESR